MPVKDRTLLGFQAATSRTWVPAGVNDELDELRRVHLHLLDERTRVGAELRAATERFRAEGRAREEALNARLRGERRRLPDATPSSERERILEPLEHEHATILDALEAHIRNVLDTAEQRGPAWLSVFEQHDRELRRRIEEARAVVQEGEARLAASMSERAWIERTAGLTRFNDEQTRIIEPAQLAYARLPDPLAGRVIGNGASGWPVEPAPTPLGDVQEMTAEQMAEWIERERPPLATMLVVAGDSPEIAGRLIEAECSGEDRAADDEIVAALRPIAEREEGDDDGDA